MTQAKAAVLRSASGRYAMEVVTLADLGPDEILVKIAGCGMCHTDMMPRSPGLASRILPMITGHEGSGVVEAVGVAVRSVKPGDHVLLSYGSCGRCANCLAGQPYYCDGFEARNMSGRDADGRVSATDATGAPVANRWFAQSAFAQYAVATERNAVVVDKDLPLELLGPLGCGLQTGAGAVLNEMRLAPGQSIAVFGAGTVGLAAVMAAKLSGAGEIVVVDLHQQRLELARELGATRTVVGGEGDVVAEVKGAGRGVDFSIETTAVTPVIQAAVAVLARPGMAVMVGAGAGELSLLPHTLVGRKVTYIYEGAAVPQLFLPRLIQFWREGRFPFERLVRTYPLSQIDAAEADSLSGATVKPVLIPD